MKQIPIPIRGIFIGCSILIVLGCGSTSEVLITNIPAYTLSYIGAPPLQDARLRFREIFCELLESKRKSQNLNIDCEEYLWRFNDERLPAGIRRPLPVHDTHLRILIVPGAFADCFPKIGMPYKTAIKDLMQLGYRIDYIQVSGRAGSEANADFIAKTIADLDIDTSERLLLIGYSKGTTDILHFLVNFPDLARKVTAVLSVAGAVNGSVVADKYAKTYHTWFEDLSLGECLPGDGGVLDSLTRVEQFQWLASHPLPQTVQYYSIADFAKEKDIQALLRITYELLERIDPLNDGQLLICDQLIPGSKLMAYVNADHWTVAVPVEEAFSGRDPDTTARNEKLRTLLFEAMILFMVEDLQQNSG
jgi:hypothetical protein